MSTSRPPSRDPRIRAALDAQAAAIDWPALEDVTHRDAGGRGLAAYRRAGEYLDRGQLRAAALDLAEHARCVAIVTGFCAVVADRVTAETDGPPGALFLAHVLEALGIDVMLITDCHALELLKCGRALLGLKRSEVVEFPFHDSDRWSDEFLTHGRGSTLTHLIAIERPGPSHARDACHNMRGISIDDHTAKTHRLFEIARDRRPPITTLGIGDGGNEIGMGSFACEDVTAALGGGESGRIVSRIVTDFALIAGVSNWGAYALALAVARLRGQAVSSRWLEPAGQRELIETLVARAGAVDGRTLEPTATVDGLPMGEYLQPLVEMHRLFKHAGPAGP